MTTRRISRRVILVIGTAALARATRSSSSPNADGTQRTQVFTTGDSYSAWRGSVWSPDGKLIAFSILGATPDERGVSVP